MKTVNGKFYLRNYKDDKKQPDFELPVYTKDSKSGVSIEELLKVVKYVCVSKQNIPKYYFSSLLLNVILTLLIFKEKTMSTKLELVLSPKVLEQYKNREAVITTTVKRSVSPVYLKATNTYYRPKYSDDPTENKRIESELFERLFNISVNDPNQAEKIMKAYSDLNYTVGIVGRQVVRPNDNVYDRNFLDYYYISQHPLVASNTSEAEDENSNKSFILRDENVEAKIESKKIKNVFTAQTKLHKLLKTPEGLSILTHLYRIYSNQALFKLPDDLLLFKHFHDKIADAEFASKFLRDVDDKHLAIKVLVLDAISAGIVKQERDGLYLGDIYLAANFDKTIAMLKTDVTTEQMIYDRVKDAKYVSNEYVNLQEQKNADNLLGALTGTSSKKTSTTDEK